MGLLDKIKNSLKKDVLPNSLHFSNPQKTAIRLMYDNTSVIGEARHENNRYIINKYNNSLKPLDILAVAVSYEREGAAYRKQAIEYYERFLDNPDEIPIVPNCFVANGKPKQYISYWSIYSSLATLYEKEYIFDKAITYLNKLPKESDYNNPSDYTRVGDVLAKIDINQCVEYYNNLIKSDIYPRFKNSKDCAYHEALEKQAKGYVFKPRNKIK